jgi:hypothetical protein
MKKLLLIALILSTLGVNSQILINATKQEILAKFSNAKVEYSTNTKEYFIPVEFEDNISSYYFKNDVCYKQIVIYHHSWLPHIKREFKKNGRMVEVNPLLYYLFTDDMALKYELGVLDNLLVIEITEE